VSEHLFPRFASVVARATVMAIGVFFIVPLLAMFTGAYSAMPVGVGDVSRLLLLFLPEALAVALPIAVPTAVFLVCRRAPVTRPLLMTVGAMTVAGALVTGVLSVWVAPVTNAAYRKRAFGDAGGRIVNGRRLNEPGGAGEHSQRRAQWALPESMLVFAAHAFAASRAAGRQPRY